MFCKLPLDFWRSSLSSHQWGYVVGDCTICEKCGLGALHAAFSVDKKVNYINKIVYA